MYINKMKALIQIGIWSILFVLALPIMFGCFGAAIENGTPETVPVLLLLGVLCVLVLAGYVRVFGLCSHLLAFGNCLRSDTDGSVSAADAAEYLKMTRDRFNRMISYGEKKKILINMIYDAAGDRFVLTDRFNPQKLSDEKPFVGVSCPGCGANLKIRAGASAECVYCDRIVSAPDVKISVN